MTAPGPDPALAAVAGLGRAVEALERRVDPLTALPTRVEELAALLARLADSTAAGQPTESAASQSAVLSWLDHPADPGRPAASSRTARDAEELLTALTGWVGGIYLRYSDAGRGLPDCWLWHPDVVEELLWLHAAWLSAYQQRASASAVGDWHDRQRPGVARRIREYAGYCSLEAHHRGAERHEAPPPALPTDETVSAIAGWWTTNRDQPGPLPPGEQVVRAARARSRE